MITQEIAVHEHPDASGTGSETSSAPNGVRYYKRDFWSRENLNYAQPHFRLEKAARVVNRMAGGKRCDLLDVGCGPATLGRLVDENISYHGIDIAIHEPAPYLVEADFLETPISFRGRKFDIVVAQGIFEYVGTFLAGKLAEISDLLADGGKFLASYVNFHHRQPLIYDPYSNVQPLRDFRGSLASQFRVHRYFATSHNWKHSEPSRVLLRAMQMPLRLNVPLVSRVLAVEYFFICSSKKGA
jgi:SAM-dependent methyltransferase